MKTGMDSNETAVAQATVLPHKHVCCGRRFATLVEALEHVEICPWEPGQRPPKFVTIRARAFTGERCREHSCMVTPAGSVLVWDGVANSYTTCHILSRSAQSRARQEAA
jgi:hypothetical protein